MVNHTTEKLAELIAQRHACLVQLHKLGLQQTELIGSGEISALLRLLAVKNQLIVALQTVEQQLTPFHAQDPDSRVWASLADRERSARLAVECQTLLDEIMRLERENEQKMTERRDRIASQLQNVQSATTARRAYQAHQRHAPKPVILTSMDTQTPSLDLQSEV